MTGRILPFQNRKGSVFPQDSHLKEYKPQLNADTIHILKHITS